MIMTEFTTLAAPLPGRTPGVFDMLYHLTPSTGVLHDQQIKPVLLARSPVSQQPDTGHARDVSLLAAIHRLECAAAYVAAPRFDLHKRNDLPPPHHQVDIVTAQLKAVRLERPAARREVGKSGALALDAKDLALILPLGNGNEPATG
jgi:hypothetical protein